MNARHTAQTHIDSPLGPLLLVRTAHGLAGAWFDGQKHHPGAIDAPERPRDALLMQAADELRGYFAGTRERFDVALDLQGTPFQRSVWQALLRIAKAARAAMPTLRAASTTRPRRARSVPPSAATRSR